MKTKISLPISGLVACFENMRAAMRWRRTQPQYISDLSPHERCYWRSLQSS
ncbi:hypothetical protein [Chamaesiphon polymorphus]|uniref:hypothetical protein n=1 Tax=Chamaesiphon polymorphus TaxID=2107691 RepID=UPI0015E686FC|nr:hypothetical protein [Chamaesiphon polymorphus]